MSDPIYLDYNATTPIDPAVLDAILPFLREHFGNPSSAHAYGKAAHDAVEAARAQVAALIGAEPDEIVFTGGGSEASNHAIKGACFARGGPEATHIITTAVEHPATAKPIEFLKKLGNPQRLLLACSLVEGERSVRELEETLGIRQPGLSQQLAELREAGLIAGRKEGKTVRYRLADPRVTRFVTALHELFCEPR